MDVGVIIDMQTCVTGSRSSQVKVFGFVESIINRWNILTIAYVLRKVINDSDTLIVTEGPYKLVAFYAAKSSRLRWWLQKG